MMGPTKVKKKGPVPGNMTRREYNARIIKPGLEDTGVEYHRELLPIRFTERAKRLLNYTPRKRNYQARKRRVWGHNDPLVWSGESRGIARLRDVRATGKSVKIKIHAKTLNFRHPSSEISMSDEVTRIAPSEMQQLTRFYAARTQFYLDHFDKTTETKV